MASARGCNTDAQRLTAEECERRALAAVKNSAHRGPTAADVGFQIWPDRRFDRRGAGGAAIRVLRRLERKGLAYQVWGTYNATWLATERKTNAASEADTGGAARGKDTST